MSFNIKIDENNRKVFFNLKNATVEQKKGIRLAFFDIGNHLIKDAQAAILAKPKHGRTYLVKLRGEWRLHVASAPYEAPAEFTGALRKAHTLKVSGSNKMIFGVVSSTEGTTRGVLYGRDLELGNSRKHLEPRAWLISTIKKNEKNMQKLFETKIKQELNKK